MTPTSWAVAYGARAIVFVVLWHAHLVPDTNDFSHGRSWWSSPLSAAAGSIAGRAGVETVAVVACVALGAAVAFYSRRLSDHPGRWTTALFASPPAFFAFVASADAAGAAGCLYTVVTRRWWLLPAVAALHLEAACVGGLCLLCSRLGVGRMGAVGVVGGVIACLGQWNLQTRYFLPGAALVAARGAL